MGLNPLNLQYPASLGLFTDLYELTMSHAYWKSGRADCQGGFELFFRRLPFGGGYAVAAGLESALTFIERFKYSEEDIDYLASLEGSRGEPLFDKEYLELLGSEPLKVDVHALPEGTLVFANEPLLRVTGPLWQAQLLETGLLTNINFQTLIATKAARVCRSARGDAVLEFGLRRAQGFDGGLSASRAAFIGGCPATSNVMAGRVYGIPVKGTHAHSWVMSFDTELESFMEYARAMPDNCVFLVDTYDSLEGVKKAIEAGKWLRDNGHQMLGIRLDSGDLAYQSQEARKLLDEAGFEDARIFASNNLDEYLIESLKSQGAPIAVWGVGTKLVTGGDQAALGGVYKLTAINRGNGWEPRIKLSEQTSKINNPGFQQIRRYRDQEGAYRADVMLNVTNGPDGSPKRLIDQKDPLRHRRIEPEWSHEDLLVKVVEGGRIVYDAPSLQEIQKRAKEQLERLHPGHMRLANPHEYPVGLSPSLNRLRERLIREMRQLDEEESN